MNYWKRIGLRGQSIILALGLLAGAVAAISVALIVRNHNDRLSHVYEDTIAQAHALAAGIDQQLIAGDKNALQKRVQIATSDLHLGQAFFFTKNRTCVADFNLSHKAALDCQLTAQDFDRLDSHPDEPITVEQDNSLVVAVGIRTTSDKAAETVGYVALRHDLGEVRSALAGDIAYSGIIGVFVLVIGFAIAAVLAGRLSQPLRDLAETTTAIANGDLSRRAKEQHIGATGDLARAFNQMADSLAAYTGSLETEVQQRTRELEERTYSLESEVAERQRAEQALAKVQALLEAAIQHSPAGIIIADAPSGRIRTVNSAALRILTRTESEIPNLKIGSYLNDWNIYHADGTLCSAENLPLSRAIREGITTENAEMTLESSDGDRYWVLVSAAPVRDAEGKIIAGIVVAPEITELKNAEANLRDAKDTAEEASRMKSEFLANMSHEIRTPMTAILGFAETLQDETTTERERSDMVQTIRRNGEHLLQVINDILDISKIEAGRLEPDIVTCNPCQIIAEVASTMRQRAGGKGLYLRVQYAGAIPTRIQTDPMRFRQALINLVGNAVKFTELGGVTLRAGLNGTEEEPLLFVEVVDTGVGISDERMDRILEPFKQADASTTRRYGGTGLGLAITKRISELLGGRLDISSKEGKGSIFSLRVRTGSLDGIELIDQPVAEVASRYQVDKGPITDTLDSRVLLVEDGPDNQRLISVVLRKAGSDVTIASNGEEGLAAALEAMEKGEPYDVILMDMQMPVMDGYEATRRLRAKGYDRPIVALTAHAMEGDKEKCLKAGCNDFATKPISRRSLIESVQRHVGRVNTGRTSLAALAPMPKRSDSSDSCEALDAVPNPIEAIEASATFVERVQPGQIQPSRVLVVDDDGKERTSCKRLLAEAGYEVIEAADGLKALELVAETNPDLIVLDAVMPHIDGVECTRRLKADPRTRDIPVIILSILAEGGEIIAGLEAGVDEYVTKPIRPREFVLRVQTMIMLQKSKSDLVRSNEIRGEQARSLSIIQDLSASLSTADSIQSIAIHAAQAAAQLTCSRRVSIMLPNEDKSSLDVIHAVGFEIETDKHTNIPIDRSIAGGVFLSGDPIVVNKTELSPKHDDRYDSDFYASAPLIAQALSANERVLGVINITNRMSGRPFDRCDLGYVDLICNMVAAAIDEFKTRQSRDEARDSVVVAMATLAEYRDVDTGKHLDRVTRYAAILAEELSKRDEYMRIIDEQFMSDLERAIPLHDIGKVAIPDHILLKPGRLSDEEMTIMRKHATLGAETLHAIIAKTPGASFLQMAEDIAYTHHEWVNGSGYPRQLKQDEIPLCGRIAALADVYDALTTKRPYKEPFSHETAKKILLEADGKQFDSAVVEAFLAREDEFIQLAADLADTPSEEDRAQVLISELHHRMTTIEHAVLHHDIETLSSLAEQFKKAAGTCGLPEISEMAAAVEINARANAAFEDISAEVRKLAALCQDAQFTPRNHEELQSDPRA